MEECSPFAKADACVTVDGDQLLRTCVNVTLGPNDFLWPEIPGITLTKDGCREITDEENAVRPEGNKITRICTCSTDGCDPLQNSGFKFEQFLKINTKCAVYMPD